MRSAPLVTAGDSAVRGAARRVRRAGRRQADRRGSGGREAEHPDHGADAPSTRSTPTWTARSSTWAWTSTTCPIEPGKDVTLTHYWKMVAPPGAGLEDVHAPQRRGNKAFINADHAPVKGKYPVGAWKAGEIIRDQHTHPPAGRLGGADVEIYVGLWRGPTAHAGQDRAARRRGARAGGVDPGQRVASRWPSRASATSRAWRPRRRRSTASSTTRSGRRRRRRARSSTRMTGTAGAAEDRGEAGSGTRSSSTSRIDNADSDVWAKLDKRDDKLWTEEADEIMIDADGNGRSYVELQVAPNGNVVRHLPARAAQVRGHDQPEDEAVLAGTRRRSPRCASTAR